MEKCDASLSAHPLPFALYIALAGRHELFVRQMNSDSEFQQRVTISAAELQRTRQSNRYRHGRTGDTDSLGWRRMRN